MNNKYLIAAGIISAAVFAGGTEASSSGPHSSVDLISCQGLGDSRRADITVIFPMWANLREDLETARAEFGNSNARWMQLKTEAEEALSGYFERWDLAQKERGAKKLAEEMGFGRRF